MEIMQKRQTADLIWGSNSQRGRINDIFRNAVIVLAVAFLFFKTHADFVGGLE
jgi:hypothetical protein